MYITSSSSKKTEKLKLSWTLHRGPGHHETRDHDHHETRDHDHHGLKEYDRNVETQSRYTDCIKKGEERPQAGETGHCRPTQIAGLHR
jgi:hypothetical protein